MAFAKLAREYIFPSVAGNLKSGALLPIARVTGSSVTILLVKEESERTKEIDKKKMNFIRKHFPKVTTLMSYFGIFKFLVMVNFDFTQSPQRSQARKEDLAPLCLCELGVK